MAYIGNSPANVGNFQVVDDISSTFNGTLTSFALTASSLAINPAKSGQLLVSINGVLQEPDDTGTEGFKVSGSNIVFSSAPATGSTFWAVWQGQAVDIGTPSDGVVGTAQMSYPLDNFTSTGIDDNATSTAITIDSAEKVTIGTATAATNVELSLNGVTGKAQRIEFAESGVDKWLIGQGAASETDAFEIYNTNGQMSLSIAKTTSDATFVGNILHGSGHKSHSNMAAPYNTTYDTGISVNGGSRGKTLLVFMTGHSSAGMSTHSALYLIRCGYNGNNVPVSYNLGGNATIIVGKSASNTVTLKAQTIPYYNITEIAGAIG